MTETLKIRGLRARPVLVPFKRPPASASGAIPTAALVLIDLETNGGVTGRSYVFGFAAWTLEPIVGCLKAMTEMIAGDALAPFDIEAKLRRQLTLLDTPGLVGLALAGIDMAAWDALAQAREVPLVTLLGGAPRPIPGLQQHGAVDPAGGEARRRGRGLAGRGLQGGEAAARARRLLAGPRGRACGEAAHRGSRHIDVRLQPAADGERGGAAGPRLDDEGLYWIEEPVRHDDYAGYARIAAEVQTPIQTGENLVDTFEMAEAIAARSVELVMPDVQRIGGVTGWLRAAALAHAHGIEMSSHLFPEFSVHLLGVTPTCHWLEFMDWAEPVIQEPIRVADGLAEIPDRPGAGLVWNEDAVRRFGV
jgi:mandelate racemase